MAVVNGKDYAWYTLPTGERIARSWANFSAGHIPIEDLDDDELAREKLRDGEGMFRGRNTEMVPRTLRRKVQSELNRRAVLTIQEDTFSYLATLKEISQDQNASPTERMKASQYLLERIIGPTPQKVEISAEIKPWEGLVGDIMHDIESDEESDTEAPAEDDGPHA